MGCTPQTTTSTNSAVFPCITLVNGSCVTCYFGYTLIGGVCSYNPCNSDEFFTAPNCTKASISCLTFDRFTGACLTCANSNYTLTNGTCIVNACPAGSTNRNNTCISNFCNGFVLISGVCTSCISTAFELRNGLCSPLQCPFANTYYSSRFNFCLNYPTNCNAVDLISERCTSCLSPFTLNATTNLCELICALPLVKRPSNNQCVNLPENCNRINSFLQCIECKTNFAIDGGFCKPLSGIVIINNP